MRAEYLLFDLLVLAGPLALTVLPWSRLRIHARSIVIACAVMAVPFVAWDAAVTGRHWWFDDRYILGIEAWGLPIEEILFFFAVPYACVFSWETLLDGPSARPSGARGVHAVAVGGGLTTAAAAWAAGLEYTALVSLAVAGAATLDHALGTVLLRMRRYWFFLGLVTAFNLVFNGYLTGRPVVHYGPQYQLELLLVTIPIEDVVYGAALVTGVTSIFQWLQDRQPAPSWLARAIEKRFGGYRHALVVPDSTRPLRPPAGEAPSVLVVGGGLAGLSAAALLAERGLTVTLVEKNGYLGGKLAGWTQTLPDGFVAPVEHGFHAFFRHYYNLDAFLERLGVEPRLRPVGEYLICTADGRRIAFASGRSVPVLNLLGLARKGLYRLSEVALGPAGRELEAFMRYDAEETFAAYDDLPFSEFSARAQLPSDLRLVFNTFSRAFFSDDDRLSTAELIKSFHFYYLSHDEGLGYDFLAGNYADHVIDPIAEHIRRHGGELRTEASVGPIARDPASGRLRIEGRVYDHVVMAADIAATKAILAQSPVAAESASLASQLERMRPGQRYCVVRLWVDVASPEDVPVFVATERIQLLDAVAFMDRVDPRCAEWSRVHGGGVIELHCYAMPDTGPASDDALRDQLLAELGHHFAAYRDCTVHHEHIQVRDDFTALHVGMAAHRPGVRSGIERLYFAGDWVRLPCPAMLMEAAHTSGLLAANAVLAAEGLREHPAWTVPPRGILCGLPSRPRVPERAASG